MKISRNAFCPCGSGLKYKKCCIDKNLEALPLSNAVMSPSMALGFEMEDVMNKITRIAESKNFDSIEELQNFFVGRNVDDLDAEFEDEIDPDKDPSFAAQQLIYDAWECVYKKDRVSLAKEALEIWPDCADAYSILADDFAKTPEDKMDYYKLAVQVGKRAIGDKFFREDIGHFWGILETRPFMRAKLGLATAFWEKGETDLATSHLWELLELNPGDNQGIRYILMGWLFGKGDFEGVERLLNLNEDEGSSSFNYWRLLYALVTDATNARSVKLLTVAISSNKFIPEYLLEKKKIPKKQPSNYSYGSTEEACMYVLDGSGLQVWQKYPKALSWLSKNTELLT